MAFQGMEEWDRSCVMRLRPRSIIVSFRFWSRRLPAGGCRCCLRTLALGGVIWHVSMGRAREKE